MEKAMYAVNYSPAVNSHPERTTRTLGEVAKRFGIEPAELLAIYQRSKAVTADIPQQIPKHRH